MLAPAFLAAVVAVSPAIAHRDGTVYVSVTGLHAPAAQVRIEGGLASQGRWFGWVPLRATGSGSWRARLIGPGFLGVYPVQVRVGRRVFSTGTQVRVLPRGYASQPGFFAPADVARWWSTTAVQHASLAGVSRWQSGFFTHRDQSLNLLLRVRVQTEGRKDPGTVFLSIARLRPDGPWRLLETVEAP